MNGDLDERPPDALGRAAQEMVDGHLLVYDAGIGTSTGGADLWPFVVTEGGEGTLGYLAAGLHRFTIVAPGGVPIFDGDGSVAAGASTRLFLFGTLDALQARFAGHGDVFDAELPADGDNDRTTSLSATGAGVGYRVVASASLMGQPQVVFY